MHSQRTSSLPIRPVLDWGVPHLVAFAGTSEMSGVGPGVGVRVRGTGALQI